MGLSLPDGRPVWFSELVLVVVLLIVRIHSVVGDSCKEVSPGWKGEDASAARWCGAMQCGAARSTDSVSIACAATQQQPRCLRYPLVVMTPAVIEGRALAARPNALIVSRCRIAAGITRVTSTHRIYEVSYWCAPLGRRDSRRNVCGAMGALRNVLTSQTL